MTVLSIFSAAKEQPDALALIAAGRRFTFGELATEVARFARALADLGHLTNDADARPLAFTLRPNLRGVLALHVGIAYGIPLLLVDPRLPEPERDRLVARGGARGLVTPDTLELPSGPAPMPPSILHEHAPLAIVPTSGSTGKIKLVVLSRAAFAASARQSAANLPLATGDRWLLCLPLAHVGGLSVVTRCLTARAAVVAFDPHPRGLLAESAELARELDEERVTLTSFVPTVLEALLALEPRWSPPSALRAVLVGGAGMSVTLLKRAESRGVPLLATYGLTEACSQVATTPFGTFPHSDGSLVSAGPPLPETEVAIDTVDQRIKLRGPTLASGYLDEPWPLDADGFFPTEDRGYFDAQGRLFVLGRHDDSIVTGGENVDPRRIEAVLLTAPGVRSAFVFGTPEPRFGAVVVAALVTGDDFDARACLAHLDDRLTPSERPRLLARLATFPLLPSGKIDGQSLRALALAAVEPWASVDVQSRA